MDAAEQAAIMPEYADGGTLELVDYMYEHLDEFRLLLDSSYGTRFHNFVDRLVRIEVEYTYKYLEAVGSAENTATGWPSGCFTLSPHHGLKAFSR